MQKQPTIRVPVLSPLGKKLMPTTSARARKWITAGKAKPVWNDLNIFCVQLLVEPSGTETQEIVVSIDPGKLFSGVAAASKKAVLFTAHLVLPFKRVIARKQAQKLLRRARRGRRINRNIPFAQRAHHQKRFNNRRGNKLPPSIRANRQLELRVVKELVKLFPVTSIVYEYVKAKGNKGFSPVMVGQVWMLEQLSNIARQSVAGVPPVKGTVEGASTHNLEGWKTSILRKQLGLEKNKDDKSVQDVTTHANDAIALCASRFMQYKAFHTANSHGRHWVGSIQLTDAPFKVIARPQLYRRQLHFENPSKGGNRKRKGGTVTLFGFRSGDLVVATKGKKTVKGYIGGYSEVNKVVSIYDHNWKRYGQFSISKTNLLRRSNGLCVA
ncbi:RRXRR domain-containing protein [Pleurocapsa sp. PCC 7319]|uniref:RRXRR domain-containing protein n=1 Tax=Pleurocapsa sp. PCC 7319 TaxID=118161 RepID=UPI00036861D3|nr:RRXRR domain-containing protein [Pleurocapsa sp. PCC 7319]